MYNIQERISVAVAGLGYWGPNLVRNVASNSKAELMAVCDIDSAALRRVAMKYPSVALYEDFEEMLDESGTDAVLIAVPSELHSQYTLLALESRKHVFVEKPMATSVGQAVKVVKAANATGRVLMVGHVFLYNNLVHEVKRQIESGELGSIHYIYSQRLNLGRFRHDSDVLWTLAPHDVSILNHWLESRPEWVSAHGCSNVWTKENIADVCFCLLGYPNGRRAHLHLSWLDPQKVRKMVVVGDKKMLIYDDLDARKHIQIFDKCVGVTNEVHGYADFRARLRTGDLVIPNIRLMEPLSAEIDHFLDCIGSGQVPLTDGQHGLEVTCILEALTESMRKGGSIVPVKYTEI